MRKVSLIFILLIIVTPVWAVATDRLRTIPTRPGVTQSYLLVGGEHLAQATYVLLLFPGGAGVENISGSKSPSVTSGNFLVRSRELFAKDPMVSVVLDAPSDQSDGMNDDFRSSQAHAYDIAMVIADLKKMAPAIRIILVGTSRGTISAAYVAKELGSQIDKLVLTATIFQNTGSRKGLAQFPFDQLKIPVLLVHHLEDGCPVCQFSRVKKLADIWHFPLIKVTGGSRPISEPCGALSRHGFWGKEKETVAAIEDWILGKPYPTEL